MLPQTSPNARQSIRRRSETTHRFKFQRAASTWRAMAALGNGGNVNTNLRMSRLVEENFAQKSLESSAEGRKSIAVRSAAHWAGQLGSDLDKGLTSAQAASLMEEHGPNELKKAEAKPILAILKEQINALNILVLCGGMMCFVEGTFKINGVPFGEKPDYLNGSILFLIVFVCIVVGAYMDWSCSRVMADVSHMSALSSTVIRDGSKQTIPAENVVPGDIVALQLGDAIPADCMCVESNELQTNEIALTGEPYDVPKTLTPMDPTSPFPSNLLYASTGVVNGSGKGIVLTTGMKTEIGKIAELLAEEEVGLTSVQRTLNSIGALITIIVALLTIGIFTVSYRMRVNDPSDPCPEDDDVCFFQKSLMRGLFAAVGAIPESLQPACTFLLVMGCTTLKDLNAATVKLAAVDTIGTCSFICSDKTGTLTEGKMTCMQLHMRARDEKHQSLPIGNCAFYPTRGFDPRGGIFQREALTAESVEKLDVQYGESDASKLPAVADLPQDLGDPQNSSAEAKLTRTCMMACYLNCYNTALIEKDGQYSIEGNMSEGALVVAARKARIEGPEPHAKYERLPQVELPFSSARKFMATVHKLPEGQCFENIQFKSACEYVAVVKGAPDVLLPHLSQVLVSKSDGTFAANESNFGNEDKAWFEKRNADLSEGALRVMCIALRPLTKEDYALLQKAEANGDEKAEVLLRGPLLLMGVAGLMDPPRQSARNAIEQCHKSGIRVAMITGDQTPTAIAVAKELGIIPHDAPKEIIAQRSSECRALKGLENSPAVVDELCERVVVWSRAQPTDKVQIVESLQRQRHIVAMTGDGVNDAGALKKSDIGLAMAITGTDVTKNAADIVLLDDRFATIVDAVSEGRRIFGNIQRLSAYMLCCNVFDVILLMIVMSLGWAVPLEQAQLFKANVITHMFYPWCMVCQPAASYNMMHPPRSRDKTLLPALTRRIIIPAIFISYLVCLLTAQYAGSMLYVGTAKVDEQLGTSSINAFYSQESSFVCLYANTLRQDTSSTPSTKGAKAAVTLVYDRDVAPVHCNFRRFGWTGWKDVAEYGTEVKEEPDIAVEGPGFDFWTGEWIGKFDLSNSWLAASFTGKVTDFENEHWSDKKGWLVKCSQISLKDTVGDNDRLCWKDCTVAGKDGKKTETMPCWKKDVEAKLLRDKSISHRTEKKEMKLLNKEGTEHSDNRVDEEDEPTNKPVLYKQYNAGAWGCRKMRSTVLLTLVLMEVTMLFCFSTHEFSLPLIRQNMAFPLAWIPMLLVLLSYIYLPVTIIDQGFAPLDSIGVITALSLVALFYTVFELAKALHRSVFDDELMEKTVIARLLSEGLLHAFPTREEAWIRCPQRRPLLPGEEPAFHGYGTLNTNNAPRQEALDRSPARRTVSFIEDDLDVDV